MTPEKEALSDKFELLFEVGLGTTQEDLHEYIKNKANQCAEIALGEVIKGKIEVLEHILAFEHDPVETFYSAQDVYKSLLKQLETPKI